MGKVQERLVGYIHPLGVRAEGHIGMQAAWSSLSPSTSCIILIDETVGCASAEHQRLFGCGQVNDEGHNHHPGETRITVVWLLAWRCTWRIAERLQVAKPSECSFVCPQVVAVVLSLVVAWYYYFYLLLPYLRMVKEVGCDGLLPP